MQRGSNRGRGLFIKEWRKRWQKGRGLLMVEGAWFTQQFDEYDRTVHTKLLQ